MPLRNTHAFPATVLLAWKGHCDAGEEDGAATEEDEAAAIDEAGGTIAPLDEAAVVSAASGWGQSAEAEEAKRAKGHFDASPRAADDDEEPAAADAAAAGGGPHTPLMAAASMLHADGIVAIRSLTSSRNVWIFPLKFPSAATAVTAPSTTANATE
jgi:hypothetical protein